MLRHTCSLLMAIFFPLIIGDDDSTPIPHPAQDGEDHSDEQATKSLVVTALLEKEEGEYDQLEKIILQYEITNIDESQESHSIGGGSLVYKYAILKVINHDGVEMPMTSYQLACLKLNEGGSGRGGYYLKSSEGLRVEVVANLLRDMTMPGEYTIVVEVPFPIRDKANQWRMAVAISNPLKVRVKESE